jgi:hypothetical protein
LVVQLAGGAASSEQEQGLAAPPFAIVVVIYKKAPLSVVGYWRLLAVAGCWISDAGCRIILSDYSVADRMSDDVGFGFVYHRHHVSAGVAVAVAGAGRECVWRVASCGIVWSLGREA